MKRLFLLTVLFLSACSFMTTTSNDEENTWKATKNTECADFNKVKVFQTLNDFALANVCDSSYSDLCMGMVVVVPKKWNLDLWDDKVIEPEDGKCFVYNGTYKYETKLEVQKTVPILDFGYKYSVSSEKEAKERLEKGFEDLTKSCYYHFDNMKDKSLRAEGKNFCTCIEKALETSLSDVSSNQEAVAPDTIDLVGEKVAEKVGVCAKKYPKAAKS